MEPNKNNIIEDLIILYEDYFNMLVRENNTMLELLIDEGVEDRYKGKRTEYQKSLRSNIQELKHQLLDNGKRKM